LTPLLGHSPYPKKTIETDSEIDVLIAPLKKHLLVADEIYLEDNFYRCFDAVADTYKRHSWRDNPNIKSSVEYSLLAFKSWIRILASLKSLIVGKVIIFIPYYAIPSFPYVSGSEVMQEAMKGFHIPSDPSVKPLGSVRLSLETIKNPPKRQKFESNPKPRFNWDRTVYAWLNARLLGLDPVFPDEATCTWAAGIKSRNQDTVSVVSDLISIEILPLSNDKISISELYKIRKNEEVFSHVRNTLSGCKTYLNENVKEDASPDFINAAFRGYLNDAIDDPQWLKRVKYLDNSVIGGSVLSVSLGTACLLANPLVGLLAPVALSPKLVVEAEKRMNSKTRAISRINALL
jgi:hypothetical protein